jgi:hypothetical protein
MQLGYGGLMPFSFLLLWAQLPRGFAEFHMCVAYEISQFIIHEFSPETEFKPAMMSSARLMSCTK